MRSAARRRVEGKLVTLPPAAYSRPMAEVTIDIIKNGPYIVKGEVELKDANGNSYPAEKRMALCRCGASTNKPFCDGTHSKIGFQAAEQAVPRSAERWSRRSSTLLRLEVAASIVRNSRGPDGASRHSRSGFGQVGSVSGDCASLFGGPDHARNQLPCPAPHLRQPARSERGCPWR